MKKYIPNKKYFLNLSLATLLIVLLFLTYQVAFIDKFFPGLYLGDTHIGLLNRPQASRILDNKFNTRVETKLQFSLQEDLFEIDLATSEAKISYDLEKAYLIGRGGSMFQQVSDQLRVLFLGRIFHPNVELNLDAQVNPIAEAIYKKPKDASLSFNEDSSTTSAQISVTPAEEGMELDSGKLKEYIKHYLIFGQRSDQLPTKIASPKVTTQNAQKAKAILEGSFEDPLILTYIDDKWTIDTKTVLTLIDLTSTDKALMDKDKLTSYLKREISSSIDQPVKEGQFNFDPSTKRVTNFTPSQIGRSLDIDKTITLISLALTGERAKTVTLPVNIVQPKIKTEQVNDLGINELLGRGISHFSGSITNRIYNLGLAASRINGVLIPPGETFSFNAAVGDISAASGYKQAYVIKEGRTVLDDGGGVCQDSTTLFRAVLNAGLPVVQRVAHAYRVGYYEQGFPPGLDATVFHPSVDFKFKNDTPAHILIQAYVSGNTLTVDLYGTPDGRITTLSKPVITNQTPPPPELRQDDPTLPKGTVKQVDWAAWGANVSFKRTVTKNGQEIINETYRSNYKPWQAIYLVGTQ